MPKKILEDIKPLTRSRTAIGATKIYTPEPVMETPREHVSGKGSLVQRTPRHRGMWFFAALALIALFFAVSFLFVHAKVTIVPVSKEVVLDGTFSAAKDITADKGISFTIMSVNGDVSQTVKSTGTKNAADKARGTIILYNTYSTSSQKLIAGTRLKATSGGIYRLDSAVTIPGFTGKAPNTTPGSVAVAVTADQAGESGNIGLEDFTVVAFVGTSKASTIYGRGKTPIAGGATGTMYTISAEDATKAEADLTTSLQSALKEKLTVQIPKGFILYPDALFYNIPDAASGVAMSKTEDITLSRSGTLTAILIDERSLTAMIAKTYLSQYDGSPVTIPGLAALDFALANRSAIVPDTATSVSFTLGPSTGADADPIGPKATVVWDIDTTAIAETLAGTSRKDFTATLAAFTSVSTAEVSFRPFWVRKFPENTSKINVVVSKP